MIEVKIVNNMTEFLEYTQIISLIKDQMDYIKTPKTNEEIKETIKMMFNSDSAYLMVVSDSGLLIGFAYFNIAIGLQSSGKYMWLNEMHIRDHYRGKGYGTELFKGLVDWAKENDIVRMMGIVDDTDSKTKDFYIKKGTDVYPEDIFSIKL